MQPALIQTLRAQLREIGLEHFEAQLLPRVRLCFDLLLDGPSNGEPGESRWGGAPDVPDDFEWPVGHSSLDFWAQIRLADLIEDAENPFPNRGLLLFFADNSSDAPHIVLVEEGVPLHLSSVPDDVLDIVAPQRLKLVARADLPQWATSDYDEVLAEMSDEEETLYSNNFNATVSGSRDGFAGQLLGHVAGIGCDPRESAFQERDLPRDEDFDNANPDHKAGAKRWHNLVRFDSIRELDFILGDEGFFNFLISEDDLSKVDFSRVFTMMESS